MGLRKTKIICTIGPVTDDVKTIEALIKAGMNIARLNCSHGDHTYMKKLITNIKKASEATGIPVGILLDTKGPEIRTGLIKDNKTIYLEKGKKITLTTEEVDGTDSLLSISYTDLPAEVSPGKHIYLADGLIDLEVEKVDGNLIHCLIHSSGEIGSKKNVNVIGVKISLPSITDKDEKDIIFGIEHEVDFIAASFIRKPTDIQAIQNILDTYESSIKIIAKIEDEEGLENLDQIIRVSSGVMVARGDLGVQLQLEQIPLVQKRIIKKCNEANKAVITATQMLDSMIGNPKPTRAEMTDVANAIFDGTDAVMLSGETASGKYPVEAVETMHKIALSVEESEDYMKHSRRHHYYHVQSHDIDTSLTRAAYTIAADIHAAAVLIPTKRGNTPVLLSKSRPIQKIIAITNSPRVQRQLLLYWGIYPLLGDFMNEADSTMNGALKAAIDNKLVKNYDRVVVLASIPLNSPMVVNMIKVHIICNLLNRGRNGFGGICSGRILKVKDSTDARLKLRYTGDEILLAKFLDENYKPLLRNFKGIILEEHANISFEEIKEINPDIVLISEVHDAMRQFENNIFVSLDGKEKCIYEGVIEANEMCQTK